MIVAVIAFLAPFVRELLPPANSLGLESILATFTVGIIRGMTRNRLSSRPGLRHRRRGDPATALVAALLAVHMLGALIYGPEMGRPKLLAAGLLQATSFSFVIAFPTLAFRLLERDRAAP